MGPCVGHMAVMPYVLYELWRLCKFIVHADRPSHGVRDPDNAVSELEEGSSFKCGIPLFVLFQESMDTTEKVMEIAFSHYFWWLHCKTLV